MVGGKTRQMSGKGKAAGGWLVTLHLYSGSRGSDQEMGQGYSVSESNFLRETPLPEASATAPNSITNSQPSVQTQEPLLPTSGRVLPKR